MNLLNKIYDGESIVDMSRDVHEAFNGDFNPEVSNIPTDIYGFMKGNFRVTIDWIPEQEE